MKVGQKSNSGAKGDSWAANETKAHYIEAMKVEDANDGEPWTEMDVRDLTASVLCGDTIEEAAEFLCRSGTIDEVRRKAEELGLRYKSRD